MNTAERQAVRSGAVRALNRVLAARSDGLQRVRFLEPGQKPDTTGKVPLALADHDRAKRAA